MKSEKAKNYLHQNQNVHGLISVSHASIACTLAEKEAEARACEEFALWHSTEDELPEDYREVNAVIKVDGQPYVIIAHRTSLGWWMRSTPTDSWCGCPYDIVRWRYVIDWI